MPNERISRIPPGSQDLLAGDVRERRSVQGAWFALAQERGYEEVIPPTFEYEEVFTLAGGPDLAARLIRFVDRDGRLVALRADFTSSIARMVATRLSRAPLPLRLAYAGKVYRQAVEGGGENREIFQLGAELIGDASPEADVEVLRLVMDVLERVGIGDFQINLGEMRFVQPLLRDLEPDRAEMAREAIDRRDRAALETIVLAGTLPHGHSETLLQLPELIGRSDVLDRAAAMAPCEEARGAVERLKTIDALLDPRERQRIVFDLGEIRGLGYYSGIRFEIFVAGAGRAVGFGGRYDDLLGLYGLERPAVGFALETDALAQLLISRR